MSKNFKRSPKKAGKELANYYYPVMDWWIAILCGLLLVLLIGSIPIVIWHSTVWWVTTISTLFLIGTSLYIIDIAFFTKYQLQAEGLAVYSQLRYFVFPYRAMKSIQQGNFFHLFSVGKRKRFALSSNCLTISMTSGDYRLISISPNQKKEFLALLLNKIDQERSKRASLNKGKQ